LFGSRAGGVADGSRRYGLERARARGASRALTRSRWWFEALLDDMSGLAFCRHLRESESGASPLVLLVSPWVDEMDRILAFECGVDDFARDPFFPRELASRVQALLRRGRRPRVLADEGETRVGPVRVDFRKSLVEMDGRPVPLTWREFEVLRLLAQEQGRVVRCLTTLAPQMLRAARRSTPRGRSAGSWQRREPDRDGSRRRLSSGFRQPPLTAIEPDVTSQAQKL
jgi:hypothetical protein